MDHTAQEHLRIYENHTENRLRGSTFSSRAAQNAPKETLEMRLNLESQGNLGNPPEEIFSFSLAKRHRDPKCGTKRRRNGNHIFTYSNIARNPRDFSKTEPFSKILGSLKPRRREHAAPEVVIPKRRRWTTMHNRFPSSFLIFCSCGVEFAELGRW